MMYENKPKAFPERMKTIKVDVRTWDSLKSEKEENDTFNDVIRGLLMKRTKSIGDKNVKAIKYERKIGFYDFLNYDGEIIGFEFEYNDVKSNKSDFILDLKIKKVFLKKRVLNPSEFFGVDSAHKHYSNFFLLIYLNAIAFALDKEFGTGRYINSRNESCMNIANWRRLYYDYSLSEESFKEDIEEPLRLSEEEKVSASWEKRIEASIAGRIREDYSKEKRFGRLK